MIGSLVVSGYVEEKLGKDVDNGLYWMYATLNKAHLTNDTVGYIWFDGDKMMNKPYILPGDDVYAKKISLFDSVEYKMPISTESFEVDALLSEAILEKLKNNNITIK